MHKQPIQFKSTESRKSPLIAVREAGAVVEDSEGIEWVGQELNLGPAPCEGAVITGLDHQPGHSWLIHRRP